MMTLEEAQHQVDCWIKKYGVRYFSELTKDRKSTRLNSSHAR